MAIAKIIDLILLFCVVYYATPNCCADENVYYREIEACALQYLKQKGKLNESIQSTTPPSARCPFFIPFGAQLITSLMHDGKVKNEPNEADCLNEEFNKRELADLFIMIIVAEYSSLFSDRTQIKESIEKMKNVTREMHDQCIAGESNPRIDNKNVMSHQHEYCMVKYAVDNKLLRLNDDYIKSYRINTDTVNCTNIIHAELSKNEKECSDKMFATGIDQGSLDCAINELRRNNMFNWGIALKVLMYIHLTSPTFTVESNKIVNKFEEFLSLPALSCNKN
ncbi:hypothetical protein HA402_010312 [Bradysia odoriphaga]|nr:hypothetical protein HA402_010312 [Bradysia odoriphaga]